MSDTTAKRSKGIFGSILGAFKKAAPSKPIAIGSVQFRLMYERFREILSINDSMLQLIADVEDYTMGSRPFAPDLLKQRIQRAMLDVFVIIKNINQIAGNRYPELFNVLSQLNAEIESVYSERKELPRGAPVIPIENIALDSAPLVGNKMATLGEIRRSVGLNVPDGFAITTAAFVKVISENDLWDKVFKLVNVLEMYGDQAMANASRELRLAILQATLPDNLTAAILEAYDRLGGGADIPVAMRSSAVGEDGAASHAGQYFSELNVTQSLLLDSYAQVIASAFKPEAIYYRYESGLSEDEALMAVGCMKMVDASKAGILFTRDYRDPTADRLVISVVAGIAEGIASGWSKAEEIVLSPRDPATWKSTLLDEEALGQLCRAAGKLEEFFQGPQDVEWAFDQSGKLFILQSRPMKTLAAPKQEIGIADLPPILFEGGSTACPGAGQGPVFVLKEIADLDRFPKGSVLVARHSTANFVRVMSGCAAILTDIGSPTGHMAILSREFSIPTLVGIEGVFSGLQNGQIITVDATNRKVYDGITPITEHLSIERKRLLQSPAVQKLKKISPLISPLNLTNPKSSKFKAANCKSLHDITRFVHEKLYSVMFSFGELANANRFPTHKLNLPLPIEIRIFDVGEGLKEDAIDLPTIDFEHVLSKPLMAFLEGMTDPRIVWNKPRPVSVRGFLSVLGESMAGPPPEAIDLGGASYVVVSDRYMNFSTKAGYHFSTIDTYCGKIQNKNYIHFLFNGGGAAEDRRVRRIRFLSLILTKLGFDVQDRRDRLTARLEKHESAFILAILEKLGRLTMCTRQLDMLMDHDGSPAFFGEAFLEEQFDKFS